MGIELAKLKESVVRIVERGPLAKKLGNINIEADQDEGGTDFLRVNIEVKSADESDDADFEALLEEIEETLSSIDERYPSVRFPDAD